MTTSVDRAAAIVEIQQLACRYALGVDSRDVDLIASVFVDDVNAAPEGVGREALKRVYTKNDSTMGRSVHTISNHVVDVIDDDHATGVVYLRGDHQRDDGSWRTLVGAYSDRYVRRDGRWYILGRKLRYWFSDEKMPGAFAVRKTAFDLGVVHPGSNEALPQAFESWSRFWDALGVSPPGWGE